MRDSRSNGELLIGGDWAVAHGNVEGLAMIAKQLAKRVRGPMRHELVDIARLCMRQADTAAQRWFSVRTRLAS